VSGITQEAARQRRGGDKKDERERKQKRERERRRQVYEIDAVIRIYESRISGQIPTGPA